MNNQPQQFSNFVIFKIDNAKVNVSAISKHLKNIFEENELDERATCKNFLQVQRIV